MSDRRLPYVWDYDINEEQFQALIEGRLTLGRLDSRWALTRLVEHAPYAEIIRRAGFARLLREWPAVRDRVRSTSRKRGIDFLAGWLPKHHPELLVE
jgi:hypothetical protein